MLAVCYYVIMTIRLNLSPCVLERLRGGFDKVPAAFDVRKARLFRHFDHLVNRCVEGRAERYSLGFGISATKSSAASARSAPSSSVMGNSMMFTAPSPVMSKNFALHRKPNKPYYF